MPVCNSGSPFLLTVSLSEERDNRENKHLARQKQAPSQRRVLLNLIGCINKTKTDGHEHNGKTYHQPRNPFFYQTESDSKI
jgi:hypothetical protein